MLTCSKGLPTSVCIRRSTPAVTGAARAPSPVPVGVAQAARYGEGGGAGLDHLPEARVCGGYVGAGITRAQQPQAPRQYARCGPVAPCQRPPPFSQRCADVTQRGAARSGLEGQQVWFRQGRACGGPGSQWVQRPRCTQACARSASMTRVTPGMLVCLAMWLNGKFSVKILRNFCS